MQKLCFALMLCLASLAFTACDDKKSLDEARAAFDEYMQLRQTGNVPAIINCLSEEYRLKFEANSQWNNPATLRSIKAYSTHLQYEILDVRPYGNDVAISVRITSPDIDDARRKITETIKNMDLEAYGNAGYSAEEFEKMFDSKLYNLIIRGDFKMKEETGDFLMVKENGIWKVANELLLI